MNEVTTIGLDLAKNVFQVHGVDASGRAVVRRQLRRSQVLPFFEKQAACLVGMFRRRLEKRALNARSRSWKGQ
jgi:transposase